jgi:hypothetical protein
MFDGRLIAERFCSDLFTKTAYDPIAGQSTTDTEADTGREVIREETDGRRVFPVRDTEPERESRETEFERGVCI